MKSKNTKEKINVLSLINDTYKNFKINFWACTYFEMCYRILTAFIFAPIIYFILKYFMKIEGFFSLTNKDFITFGLSIKGLICIFLLLIMAFGMIFIEIGALTYIGVESHRGNKVKVIDSIFNVFGILKNIIDVGIIPLILITGVIGPLTGVGLCSSLIRDYSIPPFITIELKKTLLGKGLLVLIGLTLIFLLLRWILSIPIVVIEKVKGKDAIKRSNKLYKKNKWLILKSILLFEIVLILVSIIIVSIFLFGGISIGEYILGPESYASKMVLGFLLILFFIIFVIITILITPLFVSFLVELYYNIQKDNVEERVFKTFEDYKKNSLYNFSKIGSTWFVFVLIICFTIYSGTIAYGTVFNRVINDKAQITAHRGASKDAPENTLSAINEAIKQGANFAEIDVQTTKDGKTILLHDNTFKRTSGVHKAPKDLTLAQIKELDNGSFFSSKYKGEKVPTLDEVLKKSKGKIKLNIELKPKGKDDKLVENVNKIIEENHMDNDVIISSNNFNSLQEMKKINPKIKVGYIVLAAFGDFENLNVDFFSMEQSLINSKTVYALHAIGKEVHAFTINDKESAEKMLRLGVDNIITDNVKLIKDTEKEMKEEKHYDYVTFYYESIISIINYTKI